MISLHGLIERIFSYGRLIRGASSLHTPFLELLRIIKHHNYCHVVLMGHPRHIFTWHFHGLPSNLRVACLAY